MKIVYSRKGSELPFEEVSLAAREERAYSGDYYGAFSLEKFAHSGSLQYTHEDAGGWLAYVTQFKPSNFWYKDQNVRVWAYYEQYDNWQDTYGMDAVLAVYHSGHGGMDANGKFYAPLGADWGNLGTTAVSDKMRLGNEQVNYIFWSTCYSCRVLNGHNPIRTWALANKGFRMLFGFETTSIDSPNYGKYFWQEWNKNKSFSTAWLDASWRIYHGQAPSVVACGANEEEAKNRVFNERYFYWPHVNTSWWWWRWYYAKKTRDPNLALPGNMLIAELQPVDVDETYVRKVMKRHDIDMKLPDEVVATERGIFSLKKGDVQTAFGDDGLYEIQMAQPNLSNTEQLPLNKAQSIAEGIVKDYDLRKEVDLTFDRIRLTSEAGRSIEGDKTEGPYTIETTVQFKQVINGLPVLTPGAGEVRISIDNDGSVTSVHSSTRLVERLTDRPRNTTAAPEEEGPIGRPRAENKAECKMLLEEEWKKNMAFWKLRGEAPKKYTVVPDTTEIGYDIRNNEAILVARQVMEAEFENGYKKLYWVVKPILG